MTVRVRREPKLSVPRGLREVNEARASEGFRATLAKAIELLRASKTDVGRATYGAIAAGRIRVDELSDLTRPDFRHVKKDLAADGVRLRESDFERLGDVRGKPMREINRVLDGYSWDDRVYVSARLTPKQMASTLVHEYSHVLNESEEHYRSGLAALTEEYRAFYAQALFEGKAMTPAQCRELKARIIRDYGLEGVKPADLSDVPPGRFR